MAKGNTCPHCGNQTFHKEKAVRVCSTPTCKAVGWTVLPDSPGAGKGSVCRLCSNQTVRQIYERKSKFTITYCTTCNSVFLL
jgi:hypothetical protein